MNANKKTARMAGFLYLILGITGAFSLIYIPSKIVVIDDVSATINNLLANEMLFRMGIVVNLISQASFIFLALALYQLLKDVDKKQALQMVALVVAAVPIAFLNMLNYIAPLILLSGADFLTAFEPNQLHALVMVFLSLYNQGIYVVEVFWGLWLIPFGLLVFKSGFMPRILGVLLIAGGVGYVVDSFTFLLFPEYGPMVAPIATAPSGIGEIAMVLWLLIKGVNVQGKDSRVLMPERSPG